KEVTVKGENGEEKKVKVLASEDFAQGSGVTSLNEQDGDMQIVGGSKIDVSTEGKKIRIDFNENKEEDDDPRFTTPKYYKVIKYKDPESPSSAEQTYIKNFFTNLENTLASTSSSTFNQYRSMMDVDSFIRNFIVQELTKNVDGNLRLSTPLVLENDVLSCPMVWDFDLSLGNGEIDGWFPLEGVVSGTQTNIKTSKAGDGPTGWFVKCAGGRPYGYENPNKQTAWYQRMWTDPEFIARLKEIWEESYPGLQTVPGYIDRLYELYSPAIQREWNIWKTQNSGNRAGHRYYNTPQKQYDAMRKFYTDRLEWLNNAINAL
ncbi:MAG: CotH kinase family protein, partial [Bacteroidales bacterium]|nr:CotH kinase family protein [Bacteroidales bacterium]